MGLVPLLGHRRSRWNDTFIPRKKEFKVWVAGYSQISFQGITDEEITKFLNDLERMVPQQGQTWIDWDRTRKRNKEAGQGKSWRACEMSLIIMICLLKTMKEELDKAAYEINEQRVKARLEFSPQARTLAKVQVIFSKNSRR